MQWQLGLNFYSSKLVTFNPSDLDKKEVEEEIENDKYHIYMICKRKKLFFESSVPYDDELIVITLYWLDDNHEKQYIKFKKSNDLKINGVENGYYNIDYKETKGQLIKEHLMINNFFFLPNDPIGTSVPQPIFSDLEVMYIGQAFGRTSTKKIDYRLANHDKIQKVALEVLNKGSNEEVIIIGIKVETNDFATSFTTDKTDTADFTLDKMKELQKKAAKRVTEGQEITIFEASLIRFFQPKLNTEYKVSFPSPDFPSYKEIYETDFDYSAVTIDTHPVMARIYSAIVPERKYSHHQHFPLKTKSDKKTLFDFLHDLAENTD
jgi:hypothetical protein